MSLNNVLRIGRSLLCLLLLTVVPASAQTLDEGPSAVEFRKKIAELFSERCADRAQAGMKIVSLETGETLVEKHASQLFTPASNMEVVTTAAALRAGAFQFLPKPLDLANLRVALDQLILHHFPSR